MAKRWQNYINWRLNKLVYTTDFSKPKSYQRIKSFLRFYWRTAIKIIKDQRLVKLMVDDPKLWSRVDPSRRWWAIFRFLPFVNTIILNIQEDLKKLGPFYAAKLEGKSLYHYFLDNIAAKQLFNQGVLEEGDEAEESNQCLVKALIFQRTPIELYYLVTNYPAGWDKEIRAIVLENNANLITIKDILTIEDAKQLLDEFDFLKNNAILSKLIKKSEEILPVFKTEKLEQSLSENRDQLPSRDPGSPHDLSSQHEEESYETSSHSP